MGSNDTSKKIDNKWKGRLLPLASRASLIKSVITILHLFFLLFFIVQASIKRNKESTKTILVWVGVRRKEDSMDKMVRCV